MTNEGELTFQQKSLVQQGFQHSPAELEQLEWGLRFTPAVCSSITAAALVLQLPPLLFAVSTLGFWAFFFPAAHPMDLIYNHGVRHLFGAAKLPPNPFQRRLACVAAGFMNATAGTLFLTGHPTVAVAVGAVLLGLQAIVITTHFCTLSWMYELALRSLGLWREPLLANQVGDLLAEGATLVDVRTPQEFALGSLPGAINVPDYEVAAQADRFREGTFLLFCRSGARSQRSLKLLEGQGVTGIHDLGGFARAQQAVELGGAEPSPMPA